MKKKKKNVEANKVYQRIKIQKKQNTTNKPKQRCFFLSVFSFQYKKKAAA